MTEKGRHNIGEASRKRFKNPEYTKMMYEKVYNNPERNKKISESKIGKLRSDMRGEKNYKWKNGIRNSNGYVWILDYHHSRACDNYVKRAILVMEQKIGRKLFVREEVHHINKVKNDDRPENLWLFHTGNEHKRYHLDVMTTYMKWGGLGRSILKDIRRVCGNSFGYDDVPAFLRTEEIVGEEITEDIYNEEHDNCIRLDV